MKGILIVFACACLQTLKGQDVLPYGNGLAENEDLNSLMSIRSDRSGWTDLVVDSLILYTEKGEKKWKYERLPSSKLATFVYDAEKKIWVHAALSLSPVPWDEFEQMDKCYIEETDNKGSYIHISKGIAPVGSGTVWWHTGDEQFTTKKDAQGNLIEIDLKYGGKYVMKYNPSGQIIYLERTSNSGRVLNIANYAYSDKGKLISVDIKSAPSKDGQYIDGPLINSFKETNKYDEEGKLVSIEHFEWDGEGQLNDYCRRLEIAYADGGSRSVVYVYGWSILAGRWTLDNYAAYYPNAFMSDVVTDNNNPVDSTREGSFDLEINIPNDLENGSMILTFPEGFSLENVEAGSKYEVTITADEDHSWLIEFKPQSLKAMELKSGNETAELFRIVYKTTENMAKGTYDISVNNIGLVTKGGDFIPKPSVIVPVEVDLQAVGNEEITTPTIAVFCDGKTLIIDSPVTETVDIYSITGTKIYHVVKPAGKITIQTAVLSGKMIIVKGGSNWAKKVLTK